MQYIYIYIYYIICIYICIYVIYIHIYVYIYIYYIERERDRETLKFLTLQFIIMSQNCHKLLNVMGISYLYNLIYTDWKAEKNETKLN